MKLLLGALATITALSAVSPVASLSAEERPDYAADARFAEGTPPTIPHPFKDVANGEQCLTCHLKGIKGAPLCPHPVRLTCTECHVAGEIKGKAARGSK